MVDADMIERRLLRLEHTLRKLGSAAQNTREVYLQDETVQGGLRGPCRWLSRSAQTAGARTFLPQLRITLRAGWCGSTGTAVGGRYEDEKLRI